jgi:hypothetical protein
MVRVYIYIYIYLIITAKLALEQAMKAQRGVEV